MRAILGGEPGSKRDIVIANAAAALVAVGLAADFRLGAERAAESVASGKGPDLAGRAGAFTGQFPGL